MFYGTLELWKGTKINSKGKGKGLDTCYSATYMSQTRDQQRFTIWEVAADWHEPMVPQRIMWPSIARANGQLDPRKCGGREFLQFITRWSKKLARMQFCGLALGIGSTAKLMDAALLRSAVRGRLTGDADTERLRPLAER